MPDVMEVVPSRQFAQRVLHEQDAAMRSSPVPTRASGYRPPNTREHRLRLEIDLALRAAGAKALAEARAANHSPPPVYVVSSPMARVPPLTARPRLYEREPTLAPLTSPQIATSVAEAGSKSTRGLQAINCRFKNMESRAQPKQRIEPLWT